MPVGSPAVAAEAVAAPAVEAAEAEGEAVGLLHPNRLMFLPSWGD